MTLRTRVALQLDTATPETAPSPDTMLRLGILSVCMAAGTVDGESPSNRAADARLEEPTKHWADDGSYLWSTVLDQGLPALTDLRYLDDHHPLFTVPQRYDPEDEVFEEDGVTPALEYPAAYAALSWDTGYSYNHNGLNCTELHVSALINLAAALRGYGMKLAWKNEYAGTWHEGLQEDDLAAFLNTGDSVGAWFTETVVPLLKAMGADLT